MSLASTTCLASRPQTGPRHYAPVTPASVVTRKASAPATCGELVRGHLDGQDFLVNCPIDLHAQAEVTPVAMLGLHMHSPQHYGKTLDALTMLATRHGLRPAHLLRIHNPVSRGKGMASSTADITAAVAAFCDSAGIELDDDTLGTLIAQIKPSDGVHFPGIAHLDRLQGICHESLPAPGGLRVLVVDCGGQADTVDFDHERARALYREHRQDVLFMLDKVRRGLLAHDLRRVADAATLSARLSQHILPKPPLETVLQRARYEGALGVNCAHSGTVLGVLYDDGDPRRSWRLRSAMIQELGEQYPVVGDFAVIGGGLTRSTAA